MAKKMYIGIDNKARKVKKQYLGVNSLARKVKKGYIGVGGVARPFFSGGAAEYYGYAPELSVACYYPVSGHTNDYAVIIHGGNTSGQGVKTADAYNASLTKTPLTLKTSRFQPAATSFNGAVILAGGYNVKAVSVIDNSLTETVITALPEYHYNWVSAEATKKHAFFAGGSQGGYYVRAYNTSYTRSDLANLSHIKYQMGSAHLSDKVLFAGGENASNSTSGIFNEVDVYDDSLTKSSAPSLTTGRYLLWGTSFNGRAIFAGGRPTTDSVSAEVTVYDESLSMSSPITLSEARYGATGIATEETMFFFGGSISYEGMTTADAFDTSLSRITDIQQLQVERRYAAVSKVGNYILVAGGGGNTATNTVETYLI